MEHILYEKIIELLAPTDLLWIDFDIDQLSEEKPPVVFPCGLIDTTINSCEDIDDEATKQLVKATFTIKIAVKNYGETNNKTSKPTRSNAMQAFVLKNEVYKKLQGYVDDNFEIFSRIRVPKVARKGLKVVAVSFSTSWYDDSANS